MASRSSMARSVAHRPTAPAAAPPWLGALLVVSVAVSVVHYVDNVVAYGAYPQSDTLPNPSAWVVGASWFVFTAFAAAAWALLRRGAADAGALCLAAYSGSGLVGVGHYAVPGATAMAWWRQAHVVADVLCGLALLASALWVVRHRRRRAT